MISAMVQKIGSRSNRRKREDLEAAIKEAVVKHFPDRDKEYHPVVEMALVGANPRIAADLRFQANREVAQYLYPKLKSLDVTTRSDQPLNVTVLNFKDVQHGENISPLLDPHLNQIVHDSDDEEDDAR